MTIKPAVLTVLVASVFATSAVQAQYYPPAPYGGYGYGPAPAPMPAPAPAPWGGYNGGGYNDNGWDRWMPFGNNGNNVWNDDSAFDFFGDQEIEFDLDMLMKFKGEGGGFFTEDADANMQNNQGYYGHPDYYGYPPAMPPAPAYGYPAPPAPYYYGAPAPY